MSIQAPVKPSKKNSVMYPTAKESGNVAWQLSLAKEEQPTAWKNASCAGVCCSFLGFFLAGEADSR